MCGPLWAAMQVVVCERYKHGPAAMESINGGAGSFRFGTWTGYFIAPIVGVGAAYPWRGLGLHHVDPELCQREGGHLEVPAPSTTWGIAGVAGAIVATRGAAWGLGAAIALTLLVYLGSKMETSICVRSRSSMQLA